MMKPQFVQLDSARWPSGDCKAIAHLELEPAEIASRLTIRFTDGEDDLGVFVEAGIRTASGRLLLFMQYKDAPAPGTTVMVDAEDDAEAAQEEVTLLLEND